MKARTLLFVRRKKTDEGKTANRNYGDAHNHGMINLLFIKKNLMVRFSSRPKDFVTSGLGSRYTPRISIDDACSFLDYKLLLIVAP